MRKLALVREFWTHAFGLSGTVGLVLGTLSSLNLAVAYFNVGLSQLVDRVLAWYRNVVHQYVFGPAWKFVGIEPPEWLNDVVVVWCVLAAVCFRTVLHARRFYEESKGSEELMLKREGEVKYPAGQVPIRTTLYALPYAWFYVLFFLVSFLAWPILVTRFFFRKRTFVALHIRNAPQYVAYRYPNFFLYQVGVMLLALALVLGTNAGL